MSMYKCITDEHARAFVRAECASGGYYELVL